MKVQYTLPMGFSVVYYMHGGMHHAATSCEKSSKTDCSLRVTALFHLVMQTAFEAIAFLPSLLTLHGKIIQSRGIQCIAVLRTTIIALEILLGSLMLSFGAIVVPRVVYSYFKAQESFINKPCCELLVEMLPELPELFDEMKLEKHFFLNYETALKNYRHELIDEMMKCSFMKDGIYSLEQIVVYSKRFDDYFKGVLKKHYDPEFVEAFFQQRKHQGVIANFATNLIESIATTVVKDSFLCPLRWF